MSRSPKHEVVAYTSARGTYYRIECGFALVWSRAGIPVTFWGKRGLKRAIKIADRLNRKELESHIIKRETVYPSVSGNRKD